MTRLVLYSEHPTSRIRFDESPLGESRRLRKLNPNEAAIWLSRGRICESLGRSAGGCSAAGRPILSGRAPSKGPPITSFATRFRIRHERPTYPRKILPSTRRHTARDPPR